MSQFKLSDTEKKDLQTLFATYTAAHARLSEQLEDHLVKLCHAYECTSDRWKESDAGTAAQDVIDALTTLQDALKTSFAFPKVLE